MKAFEIGDGLQNTNGCYCSGSFKCNSLGLNINKMAGFLVCWLAILTILIYFINFENDDALAPCLEKCMKPGVLIVFGFTCYITTRYFLPLRNYVDCG